jgi:hypothetical protein
VRIPDALIAAAAAERGFGVLHFGVATTSKAWPARG